MGRNGKSDVCAGISIFVLLSMLLLCAPGLTLIFLVDQLLTLHLDRGQLWAFGTTASAMMIFVSVRISGGWLVGIYRHLMLSLGTAAALLVGFHGFHLHELGELWRMMWP